MPFDTRITAASTIVNKKDGLIILLHSRNYFCFNIVLNHCCLDWNIIRLIWIAYYKNENNQNKKKRNENQNQNQNQNHNIVCYMAYLPKDIIKYMRKFIGNIILNSKNTPKYITI